MSDAPARITLRRLAALAGFPGVAELRLEAGEAAWDRFVDLSQPGDRAAACAALLPGFTPELIGAPAAEGRLQRWFQLNRPTLSRRVVERDVIVMGLDGVRALLVRALRCTAAPVVHYAVHHVWFIGCDRRTLGWMWQSPPAPPGELLLIALDGKLDGTVLWSVVGHELAHMWLLPTAPRESVPSLRERLASGMTTAEALTASKRR